MSHLEKNSRIEQLTILRYWCALGVLLAHCSDVLFRGVYSREVDIFLSIFKSLAGPSMTGFFILSGVVMYLNYGPSLEEEHLNRKVLTSFFKNRVIRLYPLWCVAILLDLILWSRASYSISDYWQGLPYYLTMTQSWIYKTLDNFSLNFVLGVSTNVGWSISVEWFFYICFPILMLIISRLRTRRNLLVFMILTISIYFAWYGFLYFEAFNESSATYELIVGTNNVNMASLNQWADSAGRWLIYFNPFLWIFCFLIGILACKFSFKLEDLKITLTQLKFATAIGWISLLVLTYNSYVVPFSESLWIYRFGAIYAPSITLIVSANILKARIFGIIPQNKFLLECGEMSYAMYLFHFPLIVKFKDWHHEPFAQSEFGWLYETSRVLVIVTAIHLAAKAINDYVDVPIRLYLKRRLNN
jgi:peptidoglycan/LPS O-acetylase OafA/YrhL